jgi:hypothetical protein
MACTPDMPMKYLKYSFFFYHLIFIFSWDVEIEATRAIIKKINQMEPKPKFFIVCGDIVDAFDCKK